MAVTWGEANRWGVLATAGIAVILSLSTWFSTTAITADLVRVWAIDATESGWLTNAVQIGFVCGALTSSVLALADRFRPQRIMAAAAVVCAASNAGLLIAQGLESALILRFLTGAALAGVYPPAMKFVATWFKSGRGLALGAMVGALTVGSASPHLLRGLGQGLDWQLVIAASSAASLIAALMMLLALPDGPYPFQSARIRLRHVGRIFTNRPAMLANFGYFGHMWELYAMWGWFMAYAAASAKAGASVLGGNASILAFMAIALGGPGCVLAGALSDRIGRCLTTSIMMAVSGGCALAIGFVFDGPGWLFTGIAMLWGLTIVADSAQFSAAVTELSEPETVGSMLAFQMGTGFSITVLTIWLVPHIAEWLGGWQWAFLILVPGPILGIVAMMSLRRLPEARRMASGRR